jgi:hypothetical protein
MDLDQYSPSQEYPLQYATSYRRGNHYRYYRDNHYSTTSSRQQLPPSSSLYNEILYLREQVNFLEKRPQELQQSQSRTMEDEQTHRVSPVIPITSRRSTPHYVPVRQLQYNHQEVYARRHKHFQQGPLVGYIDPKEYQTK